ncbi:MAG: hypothetical protein ACI9F9_002673 [Candidatus Paceibacteria bacterium]|jgi:hypothetical protein
MLIHPKVGAGSVRFGMSQERVAELLGPPEQEVERDWGDGEPTLQWDYPALGLEITFYSNLDWRLGSLCLEAATIDGVELVGLEEEACIAALAKMGIPAVVMETEYDDVDLRTLVSESCEMILSVREGSISSADLAVEYDEAGEMPIWPTANSI